MTLRTIALAGCALVALAAAPAASAQDYAARVARVLKATPLIDGHNDWPEVLREREGETRWTIDLTPGSRTRRCPTTPTSTGCAGAWSAASSGRSMSRPACPARSRSRRRSSRSISSKTIVARYPRRSRWRAPPRTSVRIHKAGPDRVDDRGRGRRADRQRPVGAARLSRSRRGLSDADPREDDRVGGFGDRRSHA